MLDGRQRPGIVSSDWAILNLAYPTSGQAGSGKLAGNMRGRCQRLAPLPGGSAWKRTTARAWNAKWPPWPTAEAATLAGLGARSLQQTARHRTGRKRDRSETELTMLVSGLLQRTGRFLEPAPGPGETLHYASRE